MLVLILGELIVGRRPHVQPATTRVVLTIFIQVLILGDILLGGAYLLVRRSRKTRP
jgi:hypothetical protein